MTDATRLHPPARLRLPNRRDGSTTKLEIDAVKAFATVNTYDDGRPAELFLSGHKPGSQMDFVLRDAAVIVSVAIQHGVDVEALRKSMTRLPHPTKEGEYVAASIVGAAVDLLCDIEPEK